MPLSEHEQKLLAQLEQALVAEDPRFASHMRAAHHPGRRRHLVLGGLVVLAGLGMVLGGVGLPLLALGVAGFVVMIGGAAYALTPPRNSLADPTAAPKSKPRPSRPGFVERMDDRWDRRDRDA